MIDPMSSKLLRCKGYQADARIGNKQFLLPYFVQDDKMLLVPIKNAGECSQFNKPLISQLDSMRSKPYALGRLANTQQATSYFADLSGVSKQLKRDALSVVSRNHP